ncbi:MAG: PHP domain-containing protein [Thermoplasmata archaeon]
MNPKTSDRLLPFSGDLHVHSALSPCAENRMTPKEVLKKIISLGIDVFSITDHNSGFNCSAFEVASLERDILFIPAIELQSLEEVHLLGYFPDIQALNTFCSTIVKSGLRPGKKNDPSIFGNQIKIHRSGDVIGEEEDMLSMPLTLSVNELVDRIHDFKGIAVAAHIDRGFSLISQLGYLPPELKIDAVEVGDIKKIDNMRVEFLKDRDLNIISSSDSHYLDMMKPPKMKLWLNKPDVQSCLNCIKGEGPGKITISEKRRSKPKRTHDHGENCVCHERDWKAIYRQK